MEAKRILSAEAKRKGKTDSRAEVASERDRHSDALSASNIRASVTDRTFHRKNVRFESVLSSFRVSACGGPAASVPPVSFSSDFER